MKEYKYQMHTHTSPCSACAVTTPRELCEALVSGGYAGAVLTNHFYGGNTGIDRSLPWEDFISAYEEDYNKCREEASRFDLDIIFCIEQAVKGHREFLVYGITVEILKAHPELRDNRFEDWKRVAVENDLLIIQAHPYRKLPYITMPYPLPLDFIDGIECYNHWNPKEENDEAFGFAQENPHLILTSGGDTHRPDNVCRGGITVTRRIKNEKELVSVLRNGDYSLILN
ncbi:MAG: hypothetical protein IKV53_00110 [Clostridia bacterium]|nr:hypothetical protein [Clostridia bacterium]